MEWIEFNVKEAQWEPNPPSPQLLTLWEQNRHDAVKLIKKNARRSVYAVTIEKGNDISYFFKLDHPRELRNQVKGWFRSKIKNEYQHLQLLQNLGIPAPIPVAYGLWKVYGLLITRAVPNTKPADIVWKEKKNEPNTLKKFLSGLHSLIHRLIQTRIIWNDFHLGNLLIQEMNNHYVWTLVDAADLKQKTKSLTPKDIIGYLRILTSFFPELSEDAALTFLEDFIPYFPPGYTSKQLWREILQLAVSLFYKRDTGMITRLTKKSSLMRNELSIMGEWLLIPDFPLRLAEYLICVHQHLRHDYPEKLTKVSTKRSLSIIDSANGRFVVKEFISPVPFKWFRPDYRAWINNWRMKFAGFRVPQMFAWLRSHTGPRSGYLIMEWIEGDNLFNVLRDHPESREYWVEALWAYVRQLYRWRCFHRDLKLTNFIANSKGLYLVDNDDMVFNISLSTYHWNRNQRHLLGDCSQSFGEWLKEWMTNHDWGKQLLCEVL